MGFNEKITRYLFFIFLVSFISFVYGPSLYHVPRSDDINYFAELAGKKSFTALTFQHYALDRHRLFSESDPLLFRPIVHFILGSEKYFFGYHFFYWHLLSLGLHIVIVFLLLRFLRLIHDGPWAYLCTAFFAFMFVNIEMVTWINITPYLFYLVCILLILEQVYRYLYRKEISPRRLGFMTGLFMLACFTYEITFLYAGIIFLYLWKGIEKEKRDKRLVLILLPGIIYVLVAFGHLILGANTSVGPRGMAASFSLIKSVQNAFTAVVWWLYSGLVPFEFRILPAARTILSLRDGFLISVINGISVPLVAAAFVVFCLQIMRQPRKKRWEFWNKQRLWSFHSLILWLLLIFTVVIAVGRLNVSGQSSLGNHLYYHYIFWLLLLIFIYAYANNKKINYPGFLKAVLAGSMIILMILNGLYLFRVNQKRARDDHMRYLLIQRVERLIKEHGQESDFSFYVGPRQGNYIVSWFMKKKGKQYRHYSFIEGLYPQYYNRVNPKYILRD